MWAIIKHFVVFSNIELAGEKAAKLLDYLVGSIRIEVTLKSRTENDMAYANWH